MAYLEYRVHSEVKNFVKSVTFIFHSLMQNATLQFLFIFKVQV